MNYTHLFLLWLFYFASFCAQNTSQGAAITTKSIDGPQGRRDVRTTAYTRSRHNTAKNANGLRLRAGDLNSAAADWSRFPLGTKFTICGTHQTYVVDDYGPALVGTNRIDLYMPSLQEMHHWGCPQSHD
jgi:3D (Asp-Asp-Asp) domain-containing protein